MTDDRANPLNRQPQTTQSINSEPTNIQSTITQVQTNMSTNSPTSTHTHSTATNSAATNSSAISNRADKVESSPEPQIKEINIAIAGVTYPIYCPIHEQEELHAAVSYINDFALNLRKNAPNLSQENLLVLCCLNLHEKIHTGERIEEDRIQKAKHSEVLLNKIIKDAQSIL